MKNLLFKYNLHFGFFMGIFCILFILNVQAQKNSERLKTEITQALSDWNTHAKNGDLEKFMALYDKSANIMMVGSDKGEIFKGKDEIRTWLTALLKHAGFSWEMNRIDIDGYKKTAWVFIDGFMIVKWDTGQSRKGPYRFTGIMVKKKGVWKWRLFNGSIPKGE